MIANWAMMASARHPIFRQTLFNLVDIIQREHQRLPAIFMLPTEARWKVVHCATGPVLLTSSIFETMLLNKISFDNTSYLFMTNTDFKEFDGEFKVSSGEKYMPHTHCKHRNLPSTYLLLHRALLVDSYFLLSAHSFTFIRSSNQTKLHYICAYIYSLTTHSSIHSFTH